MENKDPLTSFLETIQANFESLPDDEKKLAVEELESIIEEYNQGLKEIENEIKFSPEA